MKEQICCLMKRSTSSVGVDKAMIINDECVTPLVCLDRQEKSRLPPERPMKTLPRLSSSLL